LALNGPVDPANSGKPALREEPRGLFEEILSLLGSVASYFQNLAALAGEESKEALALGLRVVLLLLVALFFAGFGYALLVIAVAFFAAHFLGVSWFWILWGFTVLHFIVTFVCFNRIKALCRTKLFESTRREITADIEALRKEKRP
jgi:uncharacterized membrane protein YqjE